jgi:alkyl sulfatase BDS1-like metallo-beta-lactamase superfamily hydrolase
MPSVYENEQQFEEVFVELLERVCARGGRDLDDVVKRKTVVRFRVTDPDVEMLVDGRVAPLSVSFGPSGTKATLTIDLSADSLHEVLLGTLPLGKAMSSGRLKVKGSMLKAMRLQGLFHAFQADYPALAAERLGTEPDS